MKGFTMDATKILQETVKFAVATVTTKFVTDIATEHTDANEIIVKVGSYATGAIVADFLKPKTDAIVVKTISAVKKASRKNRIKEA
jgi:hypothetical protein